MLSIALLEKSLKTKIYPCGGTCIITDVPSEEALPPCPRYARASLHGIITSHGATKKHVTPVMRGWNGSQNWQQNWEHKL